jgi:precorrin-2 dehydrogenase/sirohydrochlorin ferrochelatase
VDGVSADLAFFPLMLRLQGRTCLIVGGGEVAAAKIRGLLHCGAKVVVVSPSAVRQIQEQARAGLIVWHRRAFSARDVEGALLVIAATSCSPINNAVFHACHERGALCNAVDDPENCDFFYPAVVRRGGLQIAISTNGSSPALAARLRRELEEQFGPEWGFWVQHLGRKRRELLAKEIPTEARRRRLLRMASAEAFKAFLREFDRQKSAKKGSAKA